MQTNTTFRTGSDQRDWNRRQFCRNISSITFVYNLSLLLSASNKYKDCWSKDSAANSSLLYHVNFKELTTHWHRGLFICDELASKKDPDVRQILTCYLELCAVKSVLIIWSWTILLCRELLIGWAKFSPIINKRVNTASYSLLHSRQLHYISLLYPVMLCFLIQENCKTYIQISYVKCDSPLFNLFYAHIHF